MSSIYQKLGVAAASTALSLIAPQWADAASLYSLTDLGSLTGETFSYASGINNSGQVIINGGLDSTRAFIYSNGQLNEISPLPGDDSIAVTDINNFGQVVGNSGNSTSYSGNHALIYSGGTTQSLGGIEGIPYAINDSGQVVGGTTGGGIFPELAFPYGAAFLYSGGTTTIINNDLEANYVAYGINNLTQVVGIFSPSRAFLYDNGTFTSITRDYSGPAQDINDLGQVVGYSLNDGNVETAFLYSSNTGLISLGTVSPTDTFSYGLGINNLGQVVGSSGIYSNLYSTTGNGIRAFLYSDGVIQDLNSLIVSNPGFILTQARDINDVGQIVGAGTINGELHAVLLTPYQKIPESSLSVGILTFVAIGAGSQVKRKA
ncbi:DUF3466 family protein [Nostoc sp. UHCC 0702]|nr:DUF3466 family protein [Nostoc sp. UHCC 0702]